MSCSCLTSHPSGLIPFPFGLPASRPVKLLSFSFFRFSFFFGKILFFLGFYAGSIMLVRLVRNIPAKISGFIVKHFYMKAFL
jgi:hypothetical protein